MLRSMVNIDSKSKHNFGHFVSYIIYLARFCKDIDISHCVAIHFVYDLHAIRMDQFFGSDTDVNSINLHASLRYFCLHHKKTTKTSKQVVNTTTILLLLLLLLLLMSAGSSSHKRTGTCLPTESPHNYCIRVWSCLKPLGQQQ